MEYTLPIIGRAALVTIGGVSDIPAKVDTGADSSSVWASDVEEQNDRVSFVLFDQTSPLYTGEHLEASVVDRVIIASSSGTRNMRPVVELPLEIDGQPYTCRFTLADRATLTYPVLLGRHFLEGTFLVDVRKGLPDALARRLVEEKYIRNPHLQRTR